MRIARIDSARHKHVGAHLLCRHLAVFRENAVEHGCMFFIGYEKPLDAAELRATEWRNPLPQAGGKFDQIRAVGSAVYHCVEKLVGRVVFIDIFIQNVLVREMM
jgi:hypothetical protein